MHRQVNTEDFVLGAVHKVCSANGVTCGATIDIVKHTVSLLSTYKEEGVSLSPEVYICDSIDKLGGALLSPGHAPVGDGPLGIETAKVAIKRCAPLAINGLAIYIMPIQPGDRVEYGVLFPSREAFGPVPDDIIKEGFEGKVIRVVQQFENTVLITGSMNQLVVSLRPEDAPNSIVEDIAFLAKSCSADIEGKSRNKVHLFLRKEFERVLRKNHGSIILVLKHGTTIPRTLSGGITFSGAKQQILSLNTDFECEDKETLRRLNNWMSMFEGMTSCDGITIINSDSTLVGYNYFISQASVPADSVILGGARLRAYKACEMLAGDGVIAVFMKSQDGVTYFKRWE